MNYHTSQHPSSDAICTGFIAELRALNTIDGTYDHRLWFMEDTRETVSVQLFPTDFNFSCS